MDKEEYEEYEEVQHCNHCKQKIRKMNPHRMCKNKVAMLEFLAKAGDWVFVEAGHGAVVDGQTTKAPYRAQAHCSVLTWFGLAENKERRSGMYRITDAGIGFLQRPIRPQALALLLCQERSDTRKGS